MAEPAGEWTGMSAGAGAGLGEEAMEHYVSRLAMALGLGAALLAAAAGAWQNLSVVNLLLRAAVTGGLVFGFVRLGGNLAGRTLLRGLAEHQVKNEEEQQAAHAAEQEAAHAQAAEREAAERRATERKGATERAAAAERKVADERKAA